MSRKDLLPAADAPEVEQLVAEITGIIAEHDANTVTAISACTASIIKLATEQLSAKYGERVLVAVIERLDDAQLIERAA